MSFQLEGELGNSTSVLKILQSASGACRDCQQQCSQVCEEDWTIWQHVCLRGMGIRLDTEQACIQASLQVRNRGKSNHIDEEQETVPPVFVDKHRCPPPPPPSHPYCLGIVKQVKSAADPQVPVLLAVLLYKIHITNMHHHRPRGLPQTCATLYFLKHN